jgi:riboflavin biosynthesis pyrimidine reductase
VHDDELWQAYAWPERCLRANFVTTIDGHVTGGDGLSGSLSSAEDRRIFHMLRAGCDAVLVGAGTARAEGYRAPGVKQEWAARRGRPDPPVLVMVSRSGNVPDIEGAVTVDGTDLAAVKAQYPRILCEGGPHLFTELLAQGLVDELALSIAGRLGDERSLLTEVLDVPARPTHVHADGHGLYTLWAVG